MPNLVTYNPLDHPKDAEGKFVKKGHGSFIFGLAKKAKFQLGDLKGALNNFSIDLEPGDMAYKTPAGNVMIQHADGTYLLVKKDGTKGKPKSGVIQATLSKGEVVASAPTVSIVGAKDEAHAQKILDAMADVKSWKGLNQKQTVVSLGDMEAAPAGAVFAGVYASEGWAAQPTTVFVKEQDGPQGHFIGYHLDNGTSMGNYSAQQATAVYSMAKVPTPKPASLNEPSPTGGLKTVAHASELPSGTFYKVGDSYYLKHPDPTYLNSSISLYSGTTNPKEIWKRDDDGAIAIVPVGAAEPNWVWVPGKGTVPKSEGNKGVWHKTEPTHQVVEPITTSNTVKNVQELKDAVPGSKITVSGSSKAGIWTKGADGLWSNKSGTTTSSSFGVPVNYGYVSKPVPPGTPAPKPYTGPTKMPAKAPSAPKPSLTGAVTSIQQLKDAPTGTVIQNSQYGEYTKHDTGKWKKTAGSGAGVTVSSEDFQGGLSSGIVWTFKPSGTAPVQTSPTSAVQFVTVGSIAELDAAKVGTQIKHPVTGIYTKSDGGKWVNEKEGSKPVPSSNFDKTVSNGKLTIQKAVVVLPSFIKKGAAGSSYVLIHPTGEHVLVKPQDKVYQHGKVTESFLIVKPDGSATKVDKAGKVSNGAGQLKFLANYKLVFDPEGGPEPVIPSTATPAQAKKGAKKPAAPKADKPSGAQTLHWTVPANSGVTLPIKPGFALYEYQNNYWVVNAAGGSRYDLNGTLLQTYTDPWYTKQAKLGGTKLASVVMKLPTVSYTDPKTKITTSSEWLNARGLARAAMSNHWNVNQWYNEMPALTEQEFIAKATDKNYLDKVKEFHAQMKESESLIKPTLDQQDKAAWTKTVQILESHLLAGQIAGDLESGQITAAEARERWDLLEAKFTGTAFKSKPFNATLEGPKYAKMMNRFIQSKEFLENLKSLGVDIDKASDAQLIDALKGKLNGPNDAELIDVLPALDGDELKRLIRIAFKDPILGSPDEQKAALLKAAKYRILAAEALSTKPVSAKPATTTSLQDSMTNAEFKAIGKMPQVLVTSVPGIPDSPHHMNVYKGGGLYAVFDEDGNSLGDVTVQAIKNAITAGTLEGDPGKNPKSISGDTSAIEFSVKLDTYVEMSSEVPHTLSDLYQGYEDDINSQKAMILEGVVKAEVAELSTKTLDGSAVPLDQWAFVQFGGSAKQKSMFALMSMQGDATLAHAVNLSTGLDGSVTESDVSTMFGGWESNPGATAGWMALLSRLHSEPWGQKILDVKKTSVSAGLGSKATWPTNFTKEEQAQVAAFLGLHHQMGLDEPWKPEDLGADAPIVAMALESMLPAIQAADAHFKAKGAFPELGESLLVMKIGKDVPKPTLISDKAWDLAVQAVTEKSIMDKIKKETPPLESIDAFSVFNQVGIPKTQALVATPELVHAVAWAYSVYNSSFVPQKDKDEAKQTLAGLKALAESGYFAKTGATNYVDPDLPTPILVPPGTTVYKSDSGYSKSWVLVWKDASGTEKGVTLSTGYSGTINLSGTASYTLNDIKNGNSGLKVVFKGSSKLTLKDAQDDFATVSKYPPNQMTWDWLADKEWEPWPTGPDAPSITQALAPFEFKHLQPYADLDAETSWPLTTANFAKLPPGVQFAAYKALDHSDSSAMDLIEWKLGKGYYATAIAHHNLDPSAPYAGKIQKNKTSYDDMIEWTPQEIAAYAKDFNVDATPLAIAVHLAKAAEAPPSASKVKADVSELKLTKTGKKLGGMHSKSVWTDQVGDEWMVKAFPSDPNGAARVDAENQANKMGRLLGFHQPETTTQMVEGKYSYVQFLAPAKGDLSGKHPSDLSDELLIQAMEEHVLDWVISNHDTHEQNLLISPDGTTIIGIDKGQAFKFFPKDKLAAGYLPPGNGAPVWYDRFYADLKSGKISKERADLVTRSVLARAWKVATQSDSAYRAHLEDPKDGAMAKRTKFPPEYPTREKFIEALMARKAAAFDDFTKFYKGLYAQSPYEFDVDVEALKVTKVGGAHVAVTADFAADVKASSIHGVSLMFGTTALEDAHILMYTTKAADGSLTLRGDSKLRKGADQIVTAWLKSQTIHSALGSNSPAAAVVPTGPSHTTLPDLPEAFAKLKAYAQTVNHHFDDKAYNSGTVDSAVAAQAELKEKIKKVEDHIAATPKKTYSSFVTHEQQQAWLSEAKRMVTEFAMTDAAHAQQVKIQTLYPDQGHFQAPSYTPSFDLVTDGNPTTKEKWETDTGAILESTTDGGYFFTAPDGKVTVIGSSEFSTLVQDAQAGGGKKLSVGPPTKQVTYDKWTLTKGDQHITIEAQEDGTWKQTGLATQPLTIQGDVVAQVVQDLEGAGYSSKFDPSNQTEDTSTVVQAGAKKVTIYHRKANYLEGSLDLEKGVLKETGVSEGTLATGQQYDIEYGDVLIEYKPWKEPGVAPAQQGLLQFSIKNWNGSTAQVDEVLEVYKIMGVDLTPADRTSLELTYWRMLNGILAERKDREDPKFATVKAALQAAIQNNPKMTPEEELQALRAAWATYMGIDKVKAVEEKELFAPRFAGQRPQDGGLLSGRPYWIRPDYTEGDIVKTGRVQYTQITYAGSTNDFYSIVKSGVMISTEERLRILGKQKTGASSNADQQKGSSAFVFTRTHAATQGGTPGYVVYEPSVSLRTSNYAFAGDQYGKISYRINGSPFDLKKAMSMGSSNETQVKNAISVLEDIALMVMPDNIRSDLIKWLKDQGITEIRGLPVEDRLVTTGMYSAAMKKIIDKWKKDYT